MDILATLGRAKSRQVIIAFALEVQNPLKNARLKLRRKNADAIVLNSPAAIGALRSDATILLRSGARLEVKQATKQRLGRILVALAESLRAPNGDATQRTHRPPGTKSFGPGSSPLSSIVHRSLVAQPSSRAAGFVFGDPRLRERFDFGGRQVGWAADRAPPQ